MSRRYGHIGQAAQREGVKQLNRADFGGVVHQIYKQISTMEKGTTITQGKNWLLGQDSNLEPFG